MTATTWTLHEAPSSTLWRRARWLLVGLVLCRGLVLLCVMPPFEGWDEYQHVGYVEHVRETGQAAVIGETLVPPALLVEAVKFPQPRHAVDDQLKGNGGVGYSTYWADPSAARYKGGTNPLYQAQHSPFYYRVAAPVFGAFGGVTDLRASVAGLRLMNLLLTAAAVWVVLGVLQRVVHREGDAALLGLALAAHPLFLMNGTRVANDALGVFLASCAVAVGLNLVLGEGKSRRVILHGLAAGLLVGLAVAAKATNLGLLPFLAYCWLAAWVRRRLAPGTAVLAGTAMAAGCLAIIQGELRFNVAHYGLLTSMQEAVLNHRKGLTRSDLLQTAATIPWPRIITRLWDRELFFVGGWSFLLTSPYIVRFYRDMLQLGLLGWAWLTAARVVDRKREMVFTSAWVPLGFLVLVGSYTLALAFHRVQSTAAWGVFTTNVWYACPALPWFLAIVSAGGIGWPLGRMFRPAVPLAIAGAGLAGEVVGIWGRMVDLYSGGASGFELLRRLGSLQPWTLGTPTLFAAIAGEVVVLAALVLVWRDGVRALMSQAGIHDLSGQLVASKMD